MKTLSRTTNQRYQVNGLEIHAQLDTKTPTLVLWVQTGPSALGFHRLAFERAPQGSGWHLVDGQHRQDAIIQDWLNRDPNLICDGLY